MKCPKCKSVDLAPTRLEPDLPAMGCQSCQGSLISLLYYRDWAERSREPLEIDEAMLAVAEESDSRVAMTCPKCARLMTKYRIDGKQENRLDLCASCDEAWIDNGEWPLLKSLQLARDLPTVFTDAWQKRIRKATTDQQKFQRLEKVVGADAAERAREVKRWLQDHQDKALIVRYISAD